MSKLNNYAAGTTFELCKTQQVVSYCISNNRGLMHGEDFKRKNITEKNPIPSIKRQIKSNMLLLRAVIYPDNHLISMDFQRYQCNSFI